MYIQQNVQTNMIQFKNKSEQNRYTRIYKCIQGLRNTNTDPHQKVNNKKAIENEFIFLKIFRFLADILSPNEFNILSYYHISRFISKVL